jgi:hypothetical protein
MDKFIRRENLALFRGRLDDLGITDAQRKAILRLLTEQHARGHTSVPLIHIKAPGQLLGYWGLLGGPQCQHGG